MARHLSTFAIAEMLHVDPSSVANWIDQGILKAFRTPGGHRRVLEEDLADFLRRRKMPLPPDVRAKPGRIIVVDDDKAVAGVIARSIREQFPKYEVLEAYDGFQAGGMVATLKPDLVILDLKMPGMDGHEVCRAIKSQPDTQHTEIIAITAFPTAQSRTRILECGARTCLGKPLNMPGLMGEIELALGLPRS